MVGTGMRPGEVCGLQVGDLNRAGGTIEVKRAFDPRAQQIVLPKTGTTRIVDASAQVFAALDRVLRARFGDPAQAPADAYVLGDATGHPLNVEWWRRSRGWSQALVAAGAGHFGMYSLRHFYASRLLASGEPLAYVQKQLGHANQNMTLSHYSKFIPDQRRARGADRLMAELLAPTAPAPATAPQPKQAGRGRTKPHGADPTELQVVMNPDEAAPSQTRPA
jgi:integrase